MPAKRGKKVGAVSFCKVSLGELNRILKPTASVVVSLRYAKMIGLNGSKMSADTSGIKALADNVGADVQIENFDFPETIAFEAKSDEKDEENSGLRPTITVETFND